MNLLAALPPLEAPREGVRAAATDRRRLASVKYQ